MADKEITKEKTTAVTTKAISEVKASARFVHIAPRKVRLVINQVRGLMITDALDQLKFLNKKSVEPITKLLNSAVANAKNNFSLAEKDLYIKKIIANEGPVLARFRPRAQGRASKIRKRMSHIEVILAIKGADDKVKADKNIKKVKSVKKTETPKKEVKKSVKTNKS